MSITWYGFQVDKVYLNVSCSPPMPASNRAADDLEGRSVKLEPRQANAVMGPHFCD
jgi:hypothetical protein